VALPGLQTGIPCADRQSGNAVKMALCEVDGSWWAARLLRRIRVFPVPEQGLQGKRQRRRMERWIIYGLGMLIGANK